MRLPAIFTRRPSVESILKETMPREPDALVLDIRDRIRAGASLTSSRAGQALYAWNCALLARWDTRYKQQRWPTKDDVSHPMFANGLKFLDAVLPRLTDLVDLELPGYTQSMVLPDGIPVEDESIALEPIADRVKVTARIGRTAGLPRIPKWFSEGVGPPKASPQTIE